MSAMMALPIIVPLAAALGAFVFGREYARLVAALGSLGMLGISIALWFEVYSVGPLRHEIGGWRAPLGIGLYADGLSALMLTMTSVIFAVVGVYAGAYFRTKQEKETFWALWFMLAASINGIFLAADIFNVFVFLELMTLAAVALVALSLEHEASRAGMRYLFASLMGSMVYLLGVAVLYLAHGSLDISLLAERLRGEESAWIAASLITVGLMVKTAIFPFHFWLPSAHAGAPTPVSAVLSALVVKAPFFFLLRIWFGVFTTVESPGVGVLLGVLGSLAVFWGSVQALRQERLKLVVAYSTVAQIGYLFLIFPLLMQVEEGLPGLAAIDHKAEAWKAGAYQVLAHAFAKSSLFLSAGIIAMSVGTDRVKDLVGLADRMPATTVAIGLAGISLVGLPPSPGFVVKWYLLSSSVASGQWWIAIPVILGSLLAGGYVFRIMWYAFLKEDETTRSAETLVSMPANRWMVACALLLAIATLLLGLHATEILALLQVGSPFPSLLHRGGGGQ
jgi:multicomponent Na+:H+ antiporter subunit D